VTRPRISTLECCNQQMLVTHTRRTLMFYRRYLRCSHCGRRSCSSQFLAQVDAKLADDTDSPLDDSGKVQQYVHEFDLLFSEGVEK
jgi:hypothetical protein